MRKGFRRKKNLGNKRLFVGLVLFLAIPIFLYIQPYSLHNLKQAGMQVFGFQEAKATPTEAVVKLPILVYSEDALSKDKIFKHRVAARSIGTRRLDTKTQLDSAIAKGYLVPVERSRGFEIAEMTHSYPYLTPRAKKILEQIGLSFYVHSGDQSSFTVTSLTRTEETQKQLRRRNGNATSDESTHCRGVSFDISYIRYNGVKDWNYERTKKLEGVLAALQEKGDIYVLKERNQSCFHVTVRGE
jgi:hypothetical protein